MMTTSTSSGILWIAPIPFLEATIDFDAVVHQGVASLQYWTDKTIQAKGISANSWDKAPAGMK